MEKERIRKLQTFLGHELRFGEEEIFAVRG